MIEYSITIKDENTKLVEKGISYEPLLLSPDSDYWREEVRKVRDKFKGDPTADRPDITIKLSMEYLE